MHESRVWQDGFTTDKTYPVDLVGFFIVPGWVIIGVGMPVDGFRKAPVCVVVAEHDLWRQEGEEG